MRRHTPPAFCAALYAAPLAASSLPANAQPDYLWSPVLGDRWDIAENWSPPGIPTGAGVVAIFAGTAPETATLGQLPPDLGTLRVENPLATVRFDTDRGMLVRHMIHNAGTLAIMPDAPGGIAALLLDDDAVLDGTGTVVLGGAGAMLGKADPRAEWSATGGQRIRGRGMVQGIARLEGTILGENGTMVIETDMLDHRGLIAASPGARVRIERGEIDQTQGGRIDPAGGTIEMPALVTVRSGIIGPASPANPPSGLTRIAGSPVYFDEVTNHGSLAVDRGGVLAVYGFIQNDGTIDLGLGEGSALPARLPLIPRPTGSMNGPFAITGVGEIVMHGRDRAVVGDASGLRFTNQPEHTIRGAGVIYAKITNLGTIIADVPGDTIEFRYTRTTAGIIENPGQIRISPGASMIFGWKTACHMPPNASIDNDGGHLEIQRENEPTNYYFQGGTILVRNLGTLAIDQAGFRSMTIDVQDAKSAIYRIAYFTGITILGNLVGEHLYLAGENTNTNELLVTSSVEARDNASLQGPGTLAILGAPGAVIELGREYSFGSLVNRHGHTVRGSFIALVPFINRGFLEPDSGFGIGGVISGDIRLDKSGTLRINLADTHEASDRIEIITDNPPDNPIDGTLELDIDGELLARTAWSRTVVQSNAPLAGSFLDVVAPDGVRVAYLSDQVRVGVSCDADINLDLMVDMQDILGYLTQFQDGLPDADLAEPFGVLDFFDLAAFLRLYADCP